MQPYFLGRLKYCSGIVMANLICFGVALSEYMAFSYSLKVRTPTPAVIHSPVPRLVGVTAMTSGMIWAVEGRETSRTLNRTVWVVVATCRVLQPTAASMLHHTAPPMAVPALCWLWELLVPEKEPLHLGTAPQKGAGGCLRGPLLLPSPQCPLQMDRLLPEAHRPIYWSGMAAPTV